MCSEQPATTPKLAPTALVTYTKDRLMNEWMDGWYTNRWIDKLKNRL